MDRFDDWVTDPRLTMDGIHEHLDRFDGPDGYLLGRYRVLMSSGSSGPKAVFVVARREWTVLEAQLLRFMDAIGVGFRLRLGRRMKVASISAASPLHIVFRVAVSVDAGLTRILRLEPRAPLPELVRALNDFQPEWLHAYPSIASLLAGEQLRGRCGSLRARSRPRRSCAPQR
jgi:phenylacetate-coenzyme A ligase PaaK-like adenylate-forming protein